MSAGIAPGFWEGRRVLLTGHNGFKGAWLALWLQQLGARVSGFSSGEAPERSLYALARVGEGMELVIDGDVRDHGAVADAVRQAKPEIVIHMAAQPLVLRSFEQPRETFETNVMGTVNVLEAVRRLGDDVRVLLNVTSDKCYENEGRERAFLEGDPMGGHDPYSASKGCSELVTSSYRRSFFSAPDGPRIASARAGNVIGGGDWSEDRLLPDIMRAAMAGEEVLVRNPNAVRPWQHVLNPLSGYLRLAEALWASGEYAKGWNFGPPEQDARPVRWIVERLSELWPGGIRWSEDEGPHPHEAAYLKLDSTNAHQELGWLPPMDIDAGLQATVEWYRRMAEGASMRRVAEEQIDALAVSGPLP